MTKAYIKKIETINISGNAVRKALLIYYGSRYNMDHYLYETLYRFKIILIIEINAI